MSSRRLPGKVLRPLAGKPALQYLLERLSHCDEVDRVIVATSGEASDDPVAAFCAAAGALVHRGPLEDVAARFGEVAERFELDAFVRVTADSPLLDQALVDRGAALYREGDFDVVTNVYPRSTFPSGQSLEVVRAEAFRRALAGMDDPYEHEHVTPYFYRHPERVPHPQLRRRAGRLGPRRLARHGGGRAADRGDPPADAAPALDVLQRRGHASRARGARAMTEPLRVGIIGLGVGEQHIAGYEAHPAARVTALCDMDETRLARGRRAQPRAQALHGRRGAARRSRARRRLDRLL